MSQINSPYSRFGIGDIYQSRNVVSKGMGGLASPYADFTTVNFLNPASYATLQLASFDVGIEAEWRTLRTPIEAEAYKSGNLLFNYVALGVPLLKDKRTGKTKWGLAFGLRPVTKVNYKILEEGRLPDIDSVSTLYEGNGGTNRAFIGTGFKIGNLALGVNGGFYFGQEDISTKRSVINDSVVYFQANYVNRVSFAKLGVDFGAQYEIKLKKENLIRLSGTYFLGSKVDAKSDILRETFSYNATGATDSIDVVLRNEDIEGIINLPSGYSAGIAFENQKLFIGAEYETTNWDEFSFFGAKGNVKSTTVMRVGAQILPDFKSRKYWSQVSYRGGFYTGKDYVVTQNNEQLPIWGITMGLGLPIRNYNQFIRQNSLINMSFEYGARGSKTSPVRESFFKINASFNLSDLWFIKRQFN